MAIEDLKRWQWILIGALVGLGLGYVWNGVEPTYGRKSNDAEFLRDITRRDSRTNRPIVQGVVIHPAQKTAYGMGNVVTYKKWLYDEKKKKNVKIGQWFIADIPFTGGDRSTTVDPGMTLARHLDQLRSRYDFVSYSNGWWTTAPATYAIWTAGSVVVIGGLWPIVLNGLIGAGLSRPRQRTPEFDLRKYTRRGSAPMPPPSRPTVTAEDQQRLAAMTEKLEAGLAASGVGLSQTPASDQPAGSPLRKLEGGPLELAPLPQNQDDDEIEVKGEYYPVLIHHKKTHEKGSEEAPADPVK